MKHQSRSESNLARRMPIDLRIWQSRVKLNGLLIEPGTIFDFWYLVGFPSKKNGFKAGPSIREVA